MFLSEATPLHSGSPIRPLVSRILLWGIDMLYLLAVLSVLWLAIHVISTVAQRLSMAPSPYDVLLTVLDPILLMMMLAELLHTIVVAFGTHRLPRQQLLALLWMALLRHAVVMTQTSLSIATPNAAATLSGLIILSMFLSDGPLHALSTSHAVDASVTSSCDPPNHLMQTISKGPRAF